MSPRAPSDLPLLPSGTTASVGGRVLASSGASLVLGDALGKVEVGLDAAPSPALSPGDLLVVEGAWTGSRIDGAKVRFRASPRSFGRAGSDSARLLFGGVGKALVARAKALSAVRGHFGGQGFVEVDTPSLVPSPGLDLHLDAVGCDGGYLITSPEYQMKRLLSGGLPRVFQIARCFRRGERGRLHNPEFLMLEWYRSFASYDEVMADTEEVVRAVAVALSGKAELRHDGRTIAASGPFDRITVAAAFAKHAGVGEDDLVAMAEQDEGEYFRLMVEKVEPALAAGSRPVFLVDYPASQASLARRRPDDPRFCERFELYAAGVELCNGFGELTDPAEQRARLEHDRDERARRGLPGYPIDERFLAALEEGLPPCSGNALGLDRLIALSLGAASIGEVQSFPDDVLF